MYFGKNGIFGHHKKEKINVRKCPQIKLIKTQKEGITLPSMCSKFAEIHCCISLKNKDRFYD